MEAYTGSGRLVRRKDQWLNEWTLRNEQERKKQQSRQIIIIDSAVYNRTESLKSIKNMKFISLSIHLEFVECLFKERIY